MICKTLLCHLAFLVFPAIHVVLATSSSPNSADWTGYGGNIFNNRWASTNNQISSSNIKTLAPHCNIPGAVSATPVTDGDMVYFPTWTGLLIALNYETCKIRWQLNVTALVNRFAPISSFQAAAIIPTSRTSPQIDGHVLFFGTLTHALIVAVDIRLGTVLATTQINSHPVAVITQSPTFYKGKLLIGSSSFEQIVDSIPGYKCCSFVGNFAALEFDQSRNKFKILWSVPMIAAAEVAAGWTGSSIWGSQPAIDESKGQVFIATGNTYSIPKSVIECQAAAQPVNQDILVDDPCLPKKVWQNSVVAIDIKRGVVNWVRQLSAIDAWTTACGVPGRLPATPANCPQTPGPNSDFGMAPSFVPGSRNTPFGEDTVVIGRKSGTLFALSAKSGHVFWSTTTSPRGLEGGLGWGIAVDDSKVYFTAMNDNALPFTLQPSRHVVNNSGYGAASLRDGRLLWEVAVPDGGVAKGPPSVTGDLVFASRLADWGTVKNGSLVVLNRDTGRQIGKWVLDGSFHGGVAVKGSMVMFGTGYDGPFDGKEKGSFHVWRVDSRRDGR